MKKQSITTSIPWTTGLPVKSIEYIASSGSIRIVYSTRSCPTMSHANFHGANGRITPFMSDLSYISIRKLTSSSIGFAPGIMLRTHSASPASTFVPERRSCTLAVTPVITAESEAPSATAGAPA